MKMVAPTVDTTTKWFVKQHSLTLHQPFQLGQIRNWDNMDGVLAILEPRHCWTVYTKMDEKVQVLLRAEFEQLRSAAATTTVP
ncbi:hypothetical protein WJX77_006930 [Trebouxia sp. C0004]